MFTFCKFFTTFALIIVFYCSEAECRRVNAQGRNSDPIIFLQAIWRHGDRAPLGTFPTDQYQEDSWPNGWGELTSKGMEEHYILGQKLRAKYIMEENFLSPTFENKEIYVRSTDYNRTIISAISNLIGFYANKNNSNNSNNAKPRFLQNFIPVPVHSEIPARIDYMSNVNSFCPRRQALLDVIANSTEYKAISSDNKEFFQNLSNWTGTNITFRNIWIVYDALSIEKIYNRKMPDWLTPEIYDKIVSFYVLLRSYYSGEGINPKKSNDEIHSDLRRICGGPLLDFLIKNMKEKINCSKGLTCNDWIKNLKYFAYSAHDSTLFGLANVLGLSNNENVKSATYSTAVTLELRQNSTTNEYYIKLLLWLPEKTSPIDLTSEISGCENDCSFEQFVKQTEKNIPPMPIEEYCLNDSLSNAQSTN